ncbi:hypothetical protein ElyMa_006046400 [Elysia marginata]|uniref:Uncharacterized protein n=1 Tax=Elysia marginata TaxID=1093978 RepID=A0AAV4GMP7_9GAST|nr:hypothetical protein ElyMa_006046400 [Elysia marginata]
MANTMKFQWKFDQNAKENPKATLNNVANTRSLNQEKLSNVKPTPVAYIGTSFSPSNRGEKSKSTWLSRNKGVLPHAFKDGVKDPSSHKPYASSSLWKPSDTVSGGRDKSKKTFLTLTPVGQGQPQARLPGVPLISLTPPLKVDISQQPAVLPDTHVKHGELPEPLAPSRLPAPSGCIFCDAEAAASRRNNEDYDLGSPAGNILEHQEDKQRQTNLGYETRERNNRCLLSAHDEADSEFITQRQNGFSKLSKLPGICGRASFSESIDSDSEQDRLTTPELNSSSWQPVSRHDGTLFTHSMWENPKLSRKDTLLDSISDRNLLDRKTLFSKKVNASYARITHENTVILPPVECNRRQRDVPGDSSYLLERKYVHEALKKQRNSLRVVRNRENPADDTVLHRKVQQLRTQEPELGNKKRRVNKFNKNVTTRQILDMDIMERNAATKTEHAVLSNPFHYKSEQFSNWGHEEGEFGLRHSNHPTRHRASVGIVNNTNMATGSMQYHNSTNRHTHDPYSDFLRTASDKENYPFQETRFRLPAKDSPKFDSTRHNRSFPTNAGTGGAHMTYLASQTSQFDPPSHETTHFCDVLGKTACSRCSEQKARRRLKAQENNSTSKSGLEAVLNGLGRTGIVSPPPVPSSSPTLFLPVEALHKVVIRVKDREGLLSVTSVGVNEDVVRRTTA